MTGIENKMATYRHACGVTAFGMLFSVLTTQFYGGHNGASEGAGKHSQNDEGLGVASL